MRTAQRVVYVLGRSGDWLVRGMGSLSGLLVFALAVVVFIEVMLRYLLRSPTTWSFELSIFLLVGGSLSGLAFTLRNERHIRLDILTSLLSPKWREVLYVVTSAIGFIACAVIFVWEGSAMAWTAYERGLRTFGVVAWPLFPVRMLMPIAGVLLCFAFLRHAVEHFRIIAKCDAKSDDNRRARS